MGLFLKFWVRRAAKRYARRLPDALAEGWGVSETYTPPQIRVTVQKLRLDPKFIALGFAAFLTEEEYLAIAAEMPVCLPYDQARSMFFAQLPDRITGDWNPQSQNEYAMQSVGGPTTS